MTATLVESVPAINTVGNSGERDAVATDGISRKLFMTDSRRNKSLRYYAPLAPQSLHVFSSTDKHLYGKHASYIFMVDLEAFLHLYG